MLSRKFLLLLNLLIGVVIWLFDLTPYSLTGKFVGRIDGYLPFLAFLLAGYSVIRLAITKVDGQIRLRTLTRILPGLLACLPSFAGGGFRILLAIILLCPIFWLGMMFAMDEQSKVTLIQELDSPDGTKIAEVYFAPVGAYSGGNGRVSVRIRYRDFPFIEQHAYHNSRSYADETTTDYISWVDNHSFYVTETDETVTLEGIEPFITAGKIFAGTLIVIWLLDTSWIESLWLRLRDRMIAVLFKKRTSEV